MKKIVALLAGLALLIVTGTAMAIPITGTINFMGGLKLTPAGSTTANATGIDFVNAYVAAGNEGIYSSIPESTTVTFKNLIFSPSTPVSSFWTLTFGGITYSFDLDSVTAVNGPKTLQLDGVGVLKATGFDDTPGTWLLTTQGASKILSFSATSAVPEPGTILLLGGGLVGLALYGRRRMKA